jgi:Co/Zn/Cd efflux system component
VAGGGIELKRLDQRDHAGDEGREVEDRAHDVAERQVASPPVAGRDDPRHLGHNLSRMTDIAHRHGGLVHDHPHAGAHRHLRHPRRSRPIDARHEHDRGHSHGFVDDSIKRSRVGLRAVGVSLAVLGVTAAIQAGIYVATGSVALLADLIHNFGDALTAVPLGVAFLLRSARAERFAGLAVVFAIFVSACVAGVFAVEKIISPEAPEHLLALGIAGGVGFAGNEVAAQVRLRAGRRLDSPALVADGYHARSDGFVSLGVVLSAVLVALGLPIADPVIAIVITVVILRITWQSWQTVSGQAHRH